jgi:Terminase large subunit, T4likevirus-type, N-terminal
MEGYEPSYVHGAAGLWADVCGCSDHGDGHHGSLMGRTLRLSKPAIFGKVGYVPNRAQRPIHRSSARNKVAGMGRRTGKSTAGGHELFAECVKTKFLLPKLHEDDKRREFWIVGPEYTDSEKEFRVLYNDLKRRGAPFDKPGTYYNAHDADMQISLYGGKFIVIGKSAMHPERLVGEGLNGVIMAEAAKMRQSIWDRFVRPMLADYRGWAQFNSTPEGKNWFYDLWMKGQSTNEPDWDSWRLPSWYNDVVFPLGRQDPEILAMRNDLTAESFAQEVEAKFTEFVGRVFKEWDDEIHVRDLVYDPQWPLYACCDYGFTNPFVWLLLQVDVWGNVFVLDEMYEAGLTIDEIKLEIVARGLAPKSLLKFYPDPASPGDTRTLENHLKIKSGGGTGGELTDRLRLIRAMLKQRNQHLPVGHPDRQPRLFVNRKCTNTIREMNDYRYPKTAVEAAELGRPAPEKPLKKDDHCPEALGRFMAGYFGVDSGKTRSRVSTADYRSA